jgi:hypothetical protein
MSGWLYDPKNDYIGKIFWTDEDYAAAVADGWETAPYPAYMSAYKGDIGDKTLPDLEKIDPKVRWSAKEGKVPDPPVVINRRKPGRKKQG